MFVKWIEIENAYRRKFVYKFFDEFPILYDSAFIVFPKLDGANFSVIIDSEENVNFASRNRLLGELDSFYDYDTLFKQNEYIEFVEDQKKDCSYHGVTRQFVGELCGNKINGRVKYGDLFWRFFSIYEKQDGLDHVEHLTPAEIYTYRFDYSLRISTELFRFMDDYKDFDEFLSSIDLNVTDPYSINFLDPPVFGINKIEGFVIRPYSNNYFNSNGMFIVKYKNPEFEDKGIKKDKIPVVKESLTTELIERSRDYINENRTKDLFSKFGMLEDMNRFKEYMDYYFKDFIGDFRKDYSEFDNLSISQKRIFNKSVYNWIREELKNSL